MAKTHRVTFRRKGATIDCSEDEYILEEAENAGLRPICIGSPLSDVVLDR